MMPRIAVTLGLVLVLTTHAWAQLASQTALVGTVTDSNGGVVPGAQVVAINAGTKDTYETTTNTEGYYHVPFVRTGTYEITVTVSGFQTFKATGIEVANNQVVRTNAVMCFDASAFEMPAQFTFGNAPRNVLRGPKSVITDLSMAKNIPVGQDMRLQVRLEMFNAFNNVNYGNPGSTFGAATFGRISAAGNMRQMQLGAKFIF